MQYIRTISQLPEISGSYLNSKAYFETSQPFEFTSKENGKTSIKYVSKKISKKEVTNFTNSAMSSFLYLRNSLSNENLKQINEDVDKIKNSEFTFYGKKTFTNIPDIGIEESDEYYRNIDLNNVSADYFSINGRILKDYSADNFTPQLGGEFGFGTNLINTNTNERRTFSAVKDNVYLYPSINKIFQNEYIFKFKDNSRVTNEWTCPASGIFTCYGWVDEVKNKIPNNASRWVALEAYNEKFGAWCLIQLQPLIPNNFCSYVSFTFPVKMKLKLRLEAGFRLGTNSNRYFNSLGSVSNHVLNGFIGGIYTSSATAPVIKSSGEESIKSKTFVDIDLFNNEIQKITKLIHNTATNITGNVTNMFIAKDRENDDKFIDTDEFKEKDDENDTKFIDTEEIKAYRLKSDNSNLSGSNCDSIPQRIDSSFLFKNLFSGISITNETEANKVVVINNVGHVNIEIHPSSNNPEYIKDLSCVLGSNGNGTYDYVIAELNDPVLREDESNENINIKPEITSMLNCSLVGYTASNFDITEENKSKTTWYASGICRLYPSGEIVIDYNSLDFHGKHKSEILIDDNFQTYDPLFEKSTDQPDVGAAKKNNFISYLNINGTYLTNIAAQ